MIFARGRANLALAAVLAVALANGCAEWDRYWAEDSATGPGSARDTTPPVVALLTPSGPDSMQATPVSGAAFRIVVQAADDVGVARVRVWIDGETPRELAAAPWETRWDTTPLAESSRHRLWATAEDAAGNVGTSEPAFAQVFNAGPQVRIADPAEGAYVKGIVPVAVEFPGEVPELASVELIAGVWTVGTATSPPWTIDLDTTTLPAGTHWLVAKATTVLGHVGVSEPVRVEVNNGVPAVAVLFPFAGHRVATRGTLVLQASASDPEEGDLLPAQVAWLSDVQGLLGTGRELRTTGLTPGDHVITARATNSWDTAADDTVSVTVLAAPTYSYCADIHWQLFEDFFCTFCHQPSSSEFPNSELDLRTYAALMAGGKTTAYECVYPCRPESSLVYNKISQAVPWVGNPMPPPPTFPPVFPQIQERLRIWILEGAPPDDPAACP